MKKTIMLGVVLFCGLGPVLAQTGQREEFQNMNKLLIRLDQLNVRIGQATGSSIVVTHPASGSLAISASDGRLMIRQTNRIAKDLQLEILVPENLAIDIRTVAGDIVIDHVRGTLDAYSRQGDISADVSPLAASHIESEQGKVNVRIFAVLTADLHVGAGSGQGVLNLSGYPLNAMLQMKSFYPTGTIKAPFEFGEVHIERSYGPDTILKRVEMGNHSLAVSMTTGGGTLEVIP